MPAAVTDLGTAIDHILSDPPLAHTSWSIVVRSMQSGKVLYTRNPHALLLPASNLKIVTLAAAAERLGWDFTYDTRLYASGAIADGVLAGDLIVVGSGDPSIDDWDGDASRLFQTWADRLEDAGIRTIAGRVIGDDDAFEDEGLGAGWAWDDLAASFATEIGALQFNENTAQVLVTPAGSPGDVPGVEVVPAGSGLNVRSHLTTGPPGSAPGIATRRVPDSGVLDLRGSVPAHGAQIARNVSVVNPTLYFVTALRESLIRSGIDVKGPAVDIDDVAAPPARESARLVLTHRSPPLSVLAKTMMKNSQNLYAETLLKTLGGLARGQGTAARGRSVVMDLASSWGLAPGELVMADGSGLSRNNLVTADALATILARLYRDDRLGGPFEDALPVAGVDGTLARRMKGTQAEGNVQAKTGSLTNARGMSGYAHTMNGEVLVFSILANNYGVSDAIIDHTTDAIVVRLAEIARPQ